LLAGDEGPMSGLDVQVGNGLADEARPARDDDVHALEE